MSRRISYVPIYPSDKARALVADFTSLTRLTQTRGYCSVFVLQQLDSLIERYWQLRFVGYRIDRDTKWIETRNGGLRRLTIE